MCPEQIEYNGIEFRHVPFHGMPEHPTRHTAFYVNDGHGGVIGVQVYPNGRMKQINARLMHPKGKGTKQEYLQFRDAWGHHIHIYASHAVYLAWIEPMQPGMTIDHINGCTTDNRPENLRQVTNAINNRDGGFARKLTNNGIDPKIIDRAYLLRYFDRMAYIKATITPRKYQCLTKQQLHDILYGEKIFIIH